MRTRFAKTAWIIGILFPVLLSSIRAEAATLVWDSNTETNLAGYYVYIQGGTEQSVVDVGNSTSYPLGNLTAGLTYNLYVTAYNTDLIESDPSEVVTYTAAYALPLITAQPSGITVSPGSAISLMVQASGSGGLRYQWYKDGVALANLTNATYLIPAAVSSHAGTYTVDVTNPAGTVRSEPATVIVEAGAPAVPPVVSRQPVSVLAVQGAPAEISVEALNGDGFLSYQWWKNGQPLSGAIAPKLIFSSVQTSDAGSYFVVLFNPAGSIASETAVLAIASAPRLTLSPIPTNADEGSIAILSVEASGTGPLAYQWFKGSQAIDGATDSSYVLYSAKVSDSGTYSVRVSNAAGAISSEPVALTICTAPEILQQPEATSVPVGDTAVLHVVASGTAPFTYQWFKDSVPVAAGTNADLTIPGAQSADSGAYSVTVSNPAGLAESSEAVLAVGGPNIVGNPISTGVSEGAAVTLNVQVQGAGPFTYQWLKDGVAMPGETAASLIFASVQLADDASYSVVVSNTQASATSKSGHLTVFGVLPRISVQPRSTSVSLGSSTSLSVSSLGSGPLSYQWLKNGIEIPGATSSSLSFESVQMADAGNYFVRVSNPVGSAASVLATVSIVAGPRILSQPADAEVKEGESLTYNVLATSDEAMTYQWFRNDQPIVGATSPTLKIAPVSGADEGDYTVTVSSSSGSVSSTPAHLTVLTLPKIVTAPAGQTINEGSPLTLRVEAVGGEPLSYQWFKNGAALAGATSPTFNIAAIALADEGSYTVRVSNNVGAVTTGPAAVILQTRPQITVGPVSQSVKVGTFVNLTVQASGNGTLSFQWYKNGVKIPGATIPMLVFSSIKATDFASYSVKVSNLAGSVESAPAVISERSAPRIVEQPVSAVAVEGDAAELKVVASGNGELSYQWFKDGSAIAGATDTTLSFASVALSDAGTYTVRIQNDIGPSVSEPAVITVQRAAPEEASGKLQVSNAELTQNTILAKGVPGVTYDVQVSTNLASGVWTTISTVTVDDSGTFAIDASDAAANRVWIVRTVCHEQ